MATSTNMGYDPATMGLAGMAATAAKATPASTSPAADPSTVDYGLTGATPPGGVGPSYTAPTVDPSSYGDTSTKPAAPAPAPAPAGGGASIKVNPAANNVTVAPDANYGLLSNTTTPTTVINPVENTQYAVETPTAPVDPLTAAAQAHGMTVPQYQAFQASLAQPYVDPSTTTMLQQYQGQEQGLMGAANNLANQSARQATGKAEAMGSNLDIAQGLGQYAATEAQGQGMNAMATLGKTEAGAVAANIIATNKAKVSDLTTQLFASGTTPESRAQLIDEIAQIDPQNTVVTMAKNDPAAFADKFNANDVNAQITRSATAVADMKNVIQDPQNTQDVANYWSSGAYRQMAFPSEVALKAAVNADGYKPTQAQIDAYQQGTGKAYDPADEASKEDLYTYSNFQKDFHSWADDEINTKLVTQLTQGGLTLDDASLNNIAQFSSTLNKDLQGKTIKITDDNGVVHEVDWSSDTKQGALAPLFTKWDGTAYAPGEKPSVADQNMDTLFYTYNDKRVAAGQSPMGMDDFRKLVTTDGLDPTGTSFVNGKMSTATINSMLTGLDAADTKQNIAVYAANKVTGADATTLAATAKVAAQFSDTTPDEWAQIWANPAAADNAAKLGFVSADKVNTLVGGTGSPQDMEGAGIKPGNTYIDSFGNPIKITGMIQYTDSGWPDKYGWKITGVDSTGKTVTIQGPKQTGANHMDISTNYVDDGQGGWKVTKDGTNNKVGAGIGSTISAAFGF